MPQLTTSPRQRFGDKQTHSLAINDLYFDFMGPSLTSAGKKGDGNPKAVSAGDGSEALTSASAASASRPAPRPGR